MSNLGPVLTTLAPPLGVGLIFFVVMRSVLRADRNERRHLNELDEEALRAPIDDSKRDLGHDGDHPTS